MRLSVPRVAPIEEADLEGEAKEIVGGLGRTGAAPRIFRTLAHHPKLLKRWLVFGNHVLAKSTLPPREREILILRIGWLCRAEYEFSAHRRISLELGMSEDEIQRVCDGPDAAGWTPFESALVRAADELHADAIVSDPTWKTLSERFSTQQMLDVVFTVGQYNLVSMALNSLGVQPEQPIEGFPK